MEAPSVAVPSGPDDSKIPLMGTLEAKFNHASEPQQGIQFPKPKREKKRKQQPQPQTPQLEVKKKKKKKKKKKTPEIAPVQQPQTPSASAKKKVSFSPRVVSTVAYTYSKQEYDRTPIMGIFNHFCDCCQEGIEGARFHCQFCPDFDMCQSCYVTQGANHIHGPAAFSCPELDELEQDDEGDEGDDEYDEHDLDLFKGYLASLAAAQGADEESDDALENLAFQFTDDGQFSAPPPAESTVRLADENGPLERISPEEAKKLEAEEDIPIKLLFPKTAASVAAVKPKAHKKKTKETKAEATPTQANLSAKKAKQKTVSPSPITPSKHALQQDSTLPSKSKKLHVKSSKIGAPQVKKHKHSSTGASQATDEVDENAPLRTLQKLAAASGSSTSPKKRSQNESSKSPPKTSKQQGDKTVPHPIGDQFSTDGASKKRARTEGKSPKVKKQKLSIPSPTATTLSFSSDAHSI